MNKYLTHTDRILGFKTVTLYNTDKLHKVEIWNRLEGRIKHFETLQDLQCDYDFHVRYEYKVSTKEEFKREHTSYTQNLNKIAKEL